MKTVLLFLLFAATTAGQIPAQDALTTIILVRHAEKADDGSRDPPLSEEGRQRSLRLSSMLAKTRIDAVYSTNFRRTRETAAPLLTAKRLDLQLYDALKESAVNSILTANAGKTVVLVGHSNTIPWTINYLLRTSEYQNFPDNAYGDLVIITLQQRGKGSLSWLTY